MTDTEAPPYLDVSLPTDQRVADLLDRMTVAEKVAQLGSLPAQALTEDRPQLLDDDGTLAAERARERLSDGIGHLTRVGGGASLEPGEYELRIGSSAADIEATTTFDVVGDRRRLPQSPRTYFAETDVECRLSRLLVLTRASHNPRSCPARSGGWIRKASDRGTARSRRGQRVGGPGAARRCSPPARCWHSPSRSGWDDPRR